MNLVYFVQSKSRDGLIKIGFSSNIRVRMRQLGKVRGDLKILAVSGTLNESEVHARFRHLRVLGSEWFKPGDDLIKFVRDLQREQHGKMPPRTPGKLTALGEWLKEHKISFAEAGRKLGITRAYVAILSKGEADPSIATAWRIEQWTKNVDAKYCVTTEMWGRL